VTDSSGTVLDSATTSVSGDVAYDVDYFEIKHVRGETFDVTVTVTDAAGNSASATRTVQE
jgi:subtilisin